MYKKVRRTSKGLITLFIVTAVILLLFAIAFLLFGFNAKPTGDAELHSFLGVLEYHGVGILKLFAFNYANTANIAYFALSAFLYAFMVIWLIFFIAALIVSNRKKRRIVWWGICMTFVILLVYLVFASGSQKYWQIINEYAPFKEHTELKLLTFVIIISGGIYSVCAICTYVWSLYESFANPRLYTDGKGELVDDTNEYEMMRKIIREELTKMQPFQVVLVNPNELPVAAQEAIEETPVVEESKDIEEPKEEKKELVPSRDFWEVARDVWPQLDNPKPLPKEEPKPVVSQQLATAEDDGWNRNKRQPFLTRIITADLDIKANYNAIKNELLSYGVKSRVSRGGDTFRLGGKEYAKI